MKQKERSQKCGTEVPANHRERAGERNEEETRFLVYAGFSYGSLGTVPTDPRGWEYLGSYNLKLLSNDRLGTRIVPRLPIFERNEGILQRE